MTILSPWGEWPVSPVLITSPWGPRRDPKTGKSKRHTGVDLRAQVGQEVKNIRAGRVAEIWEGHPLNGNAVRIEHADGTAAGYAHLDALNPELVIARARDQVLPAGFVLGGAGSTGKSTGPHVHLSLFDAAGKRFNPELVMPGAKHKKAKEDPATQAGTFPGGGPPGNRGGGDSGSAGEEGRMTAKQKALGLDLAKLLLGVLVYVILPAVGLDPCGSGGDSMAARGAMGASGWAILDAVRGLTTRIRG